MKTGVVFTGTFGDSAIHPDKKKSVPIATLITIRLVVEMKRLVICILGPPNRCHMLGKHDIINTIYNHLILKRIFMGNFFYGY